MNGCNTIPNVILTSSAFNQKQRFWTMTESHLFSAHDARTPFFVVNSINKLKLQRALNGSSFTHALRDMTHDSTVPVKYKKIFTSSGASANFRANLSMFRLSKAHFKSWEKNNNSLHSNRVFVPFGAQTLNILLFTTFQ